MFNDRCVRAPFCTGRPSHVEMDHPSPVVSWDDEDEQNDDRAGVHQKLKGSQELCVEREEHSGQRDDVNEKANRRTQRTTRRNRHQAPSHGKDRRRQWQPLVNQRRGKMFVPPGFPVLIQQRVGYVICEPIEFAVGRRPPGAMNRNPISKLLDLGLEPLREGSIN